MYAVLGKLFFKIMFTSAQERITLKNQKIVFLESEREQLIMH